MPLRDHFRPPLDDETSWEGFHGQWPAMIVLDLTRRLPLRYVAAPRIHPGASAEVDVATFERDEDRLAPAEDNGNGSVAVATTVWAPPRPTFAAVTTLPAQDEYSVRVYDQKRGRRLVAAIEIVSPSNKDRPESRQAFVAKCAALLQQRVSVVVIDLVTTRQFNLYADLLDLIDQGDPSPGTDPADLYAVACRSTRDGPAWLLESWMHQLEIGRALPTLPLWLADNFALPLPLETTYEETCRALRLP